MSYMDLSTMDFVRELRLRQWARKHFVCPEARKAIWHPVVLDEMCRRDQELRQNTANAATESDRAKIAPSAAAKTQPRTTEPCQFDLDRFACFGSSFVPLAPAETWTIHRLTTEILEPHSQTSNQRRPHLSQSHHASDIS